MIDFSVITDLLDEKCVITFNSGEEMNEFVYTYNKEVNPKLAGYLATANFIPVFNKGYFGLEPCLRRNELWILDSDGVQAQSNRGLRVIQFSDLIQETEELLESNLMIQFLL